MGWWSKTKSNPNCRDLSKSAFGRVGEGEVWGMFGEWDVVIPDQLKPKVPRSV